MKKSKYPASFQFFSCIVITLIVFTGCRQGNSEALQKSLIQAGSNKRELKKVIRHYQKNPADSLKFKAACYLIENMKWHFAKTVEPSEKFWDLYELEDSLVLNYLRNPEYYKNKDSWFGYKYLVKKLLVNKAIEETRIGSELVWDSNELDADFLINNIEQAFEVKDAFTGEMNPELFFEYVLPYRMNVEPVMNIREKLFKHLSQMNEIQSAVNMDSTIAFLNQYTSLYSWDWEEEQVKKPDLGFYNIFYWNNKSLNCSHQVAMFGQMLRALGIPVADIFTPCWRGTNKGHNWCGIPINNDSLSLFSPFYQNPGEIYLPHSPTKASKIYMKTFSEQQESPFFLRNQKEELPASFQSPCLIDVTDKFVPVRDIEIELTTKPNKQNLAWFSIFIQGKWIPIGWGEIDKKDNIVKFKNIPIGLSGLACILDNGKVTTCSNLVLIRKDSIMAIKPNSNKVTLKLIRKYPEKTRMQYFTRDIIGTKIQGANQSDFSDSVTLYTLKDTLRPYFQDLAFNNSKKFRYYRAYGPSWGLHIAELEFLSEYKFEGTTEASPLPVFNDTESDTKIYYKLLGDIVANNPDSTAFDGNMLTYYKKKWVGLDLGIEQNINRIRIAPRNAHNGIVRGDTYELLYWENGWKLVGSKKATQNYITFHDVPDNTLYWLKNLDHGKEEQPFYYKNEKQVFSNFN